MINGVYIFGIVSNPGKGITVLEDDLNWLHVVDDPKTRLFFCVADIEDELEIELKLIRVKTNKKQIIN